MIIYCTYYGPDETWGRMHHALRNSIKTNCPDAQYVFERSAPNPAIANRIKSATRNKQQARCAEAYSANTHKIAKWADMAEDCCEKCEDLVLIDADTLVLGDLHEAFDEMGDGDVGVTFREGPVKINAGVVYVRGNEKGAEWIRAWKDANDYLIANRRLDQCPLYGGINQASMAIALDGFKLVMNGESPTDAKVSRLPCEKWNSVDQTWHAFNSDTRVLHIKSSLRKHLLSGDAFVTKSPWLGIDWLPAVRVAWEKYDTGRSVGGENRSRRRRKQLNPRD